METRGDVLILGSRESQNDAIIKVIFVDSYSDTYRKEPMENLLYQWDKVNEDRHGKNCHGKQKNVSLVLLSVDGILGK